MLDETIKNLHSKVEELLELWDRNYVHVEDDSIRDQIISIRWLLEDLASANNVVVC